MANIFSLDVLAQRKIYKELDFFSRVSFAYSLAQSEGAHRFRDTFQDLAEVTSLKDEENYFDEKRFKYALRMCPNLEVLRIPELTMVENHKSISAHPKITALEVVSIEDAKYAKNDIAMKNIVTLSLTRDPSARFYSNTDQLALTLKMFPNLKQLHLKGFSFTWRLLNRIKLHTNIRQLSVESCHISEVGNLRKNNKMKKFEMLGMDWNEQILESFPNLTALTIKLDCMKDTCDASFFITSMSKIKSIRLLYCENTKIASMVELLPCQLKIRLEPSQPTGCWCRNFRDAKLKEFVKLKTYLAGSNDEQEVTVLYDNVTYGMDTFDQLIEKCRWEKGEDGFQAEGFLRVDSDEDI